MSLLYSPAWRPGQFNLPMPGRESTQEDGMRMNRLNDWLGTLPHPHEIVVGGNMDRALEKLGKDRVQEIMKNATYLEDSQVTICGHVFYGSPHTPKVGCACLGLSGLVWGAF